MLQSFFVVLNPDRGLSHWIWINENILTIKMKEYVIISARKLLQGKILFALCSFAKVLLLFYRYYQNCKSNNNMSQYRILYFNLRKSRFAISVILFYQLWQNDSNNGL